MKKTEHKVTFTLINGETFEAGTKEYYDFLQGKTVVVDNTYYPYHAILSAEDVATTTDTPSDDAFCRSEDEKYVIANISYPAAKTQCYGMDAEKLGSVTFGETMTGTLKKVTSYTGFSSDASQQEGYFVAFNYSGTKDVHFTVRNPKKVKLDKGINVAFLGKDKATAQAAVLKFFIGDDVIEYPATHITFTE